MQESFGLNWIGKKACMESVNDPSNATLIPCPEESVDFDTTGNVFIEGDNLEVLKLLQESYFERIKMIYIDPPYNTGRMRMYNDRFGNHSNWLSMMYPRLYLARNLLREDGVIFISIDDHEQANLKLLCDSVFGEENFVACFIWANKRGGGNDAKHVAIEHEYVLMYAKNSNQLPDLFEPYEHDYLKRYKEEDEKGKFFWDTFKRKTGKQYYPIKCPDNTFIEYDKNSNRISWLRSEKRFYEDLANGEIRFFKNNAGWSVHFKQRLPKGKKPRTILDKTGTTSAGNEEVLDLFSKNLMSYPKSVVFVQHLMLANTKGSDIILDFFAGSCTTAHSVMQLNAEDGGKRRYIMVQLPEPCDPKSEAFKAGYETIADIGKERIQRAAKKIAEENPDKEDVLDLGFKFFKINENKSDIINNEQLGVHDDGLHTN